MCWQAARANKPIIDLRLTEVTMKPVRADDGQTWLVLLRRLQSATGEELRPFREAGRTLLPSVLDRAFIGK